jgi:calmodulin
MLVDAFVAMGGNPDKTGNVEASKLVQIIKSDFKMTIDIERLINEMDRDKSGQISYQEFKNLLSD